LKKNLTPEQGTSLLADKANGALWKVAAYRIKGLKLELLDGTGTVLLRYRKVD
jgi:hypothetical protein